MSSFTLDFTTRSLLIPKQGHNSLNGLLTARLRCTSSPVLHARRVFVFFGKGHRGTADATGLKA